MSAFKTLSSHESEVVWHQFTRVTKEGLYYRVKCNLCSDEEVFVQGRMKIDMSNEVVALKYDDGEEYRTQNPCPEHDDGVCRQEKLNVRV